MERKLNDSVISKLLWLAAIADEAEAQRYAAHVIPHGADLADVRDQIEARIGPSFAFEVFGALAWLNGNAFENPLKRPAGTTPTKAVTDKPVATRESILTFLELHKHRGLSGTQAKARFAGDPVAILEALAGDHAVVWITEGTGGRPIKRYLANGGQALFWIDGGIEKGMTFDEPFEIERVRRNVELGGEPPEGMQPILEREAESRRTYGE